MELVFFWTTWCSLLHITGTICETTTAIESTTTPTTAYTGTVACDTFTTGGNAGGAKCAFPFYYNNQVFYSCILIGASQPWCSTTTVYANTFGFCQGMAWNVIQI